MKPWLPDNDLEIYSTQNEGKSAVTERFIRILKSKVYKYMTLIPKTMYTDKLDYIVNEYSNTDHTTTKVKLAKLRSTSIMAVMQKIIIKMTLRPCKSIQKFFARNYAPIWFRGHMQ